MRTPIGDIFKDCKRDRDIPEIDTSGTLIGLGGVLYNESTVIHVNHWPTKVGDLVRLRNKSGKLVERRIKKKKLVEDDVNLLFLDEPVNIQDHHIFKIIKPSYKEVFVLRLNREPTVICANYINPVLIEGDANWQFGEGGINGFNQIRSGDSGKAWLQYKDGELGVIGLSSKGNRGTSYILHKMEDRIKKLIKTEKEDPEKLEDI